MTAFPKGRRPASSPMSAWRLFVFLVIILGLPAQAFASGVHLRTGAPDNVQPVGYLPYHNGPTLVCGDCHVNHGSETHDYSGAGSTVGEASAALIKGPGINEMCLSCHDGKAGIPDVLGGDINGLVDRSAGMFQSLGGESWQGHSLASGTRSGSACDQCHSSGHAQLLCTDCHAPHGNGRPRNLQWASDPGSEPQFGLLVDPTAEGTAKFETANVAYGTMDDDTLREVSNMCIDCHHNFSGRDAVGAGGTAGHIRHPSYDSERQSTNNIAQGSTGGTSSPQHWQNGLGAGFDIGRVRFVTVGARDFASAKTVDPNRNGVFCLSCHKAHGSSYAFGMTWNVAGGTSSKGCGQCHDLGG